MEADNTAARGCPHVDLHDPGVQEDPYPHYEVLREQAPVYLDPATGEYILSRYEDIRGALSDPATFPNHWSASSFQLIQSPRALRIYEEKGWPRFAPLSSNPPVHRHYRRHVDAWFNGSGAKQAGPLVDGIIDDLIDSWAGDGRIEFIGQFAVPLPVRVICALLGFPDEDIPQLRQWSEAWARPFARNLDEESEIDVAEQGVAFQHYIHRHIEDRRREPRSDFISHMVQAEFQGDEATGPRPFTDAELINSIDHVFIGGNETTTYALVSGVATLATDRELQDRLRANPDDISGFVLENLRLESPTQGLWRGVAEDVTLHEVTIPAGSAVHLRYAAGNRDPRRFENPETLDVERRTATQHLAFAAGPHRCPGEGLSKIEQDRAFRRLLQRLDDIQLVPGANDLTHHPGFVLRALRELHLSFSVAAPAASA